MCRIWSVHRIPNRSLGRGITSDTRSVYPCDWRPGSADTMSSAGTRIGSRGGLRVSINVRGPRYCSSSYSFAKVRF